MHRLGLGLVLVAVASAATVGLALAAPAGADAGASTPDDPAFEDGLQWGLERIGAPAAWTRGTGAGTTIAVVDSGVDLQHEDLRAQVIGDVSCIGADGDADACHGRGQDDAGHGTHVAGIALAETGNGRGIAGVAPDADLLAVRVLAQRCDDGGACTPAGAATDVAAGVRWAVDHGADVINLSLGGPLEAAVGCVVCDAVEEAWDAGAIPVIAAGTDAELPDGLIEAHAVVVTATTRSGALAPYAAGDLAQLRSARWLVAAPGGEAEADVAECAPGGEPRGVLSTYWVAGGSDEYACQAGTSMAAPHVAGALAVLLGQGRSPQEAVDRLLATVDDLGPAGRDGRLGVGLVDLERAVSDHAAGSLPGDDPVWWPLPATVAVLVGATAAGARRAARRSPPVDARQ